MEVMKEPGQDPIQYREDNDWMRFALLSAGLGIWDMNPVEGTISWDDRCRELYGFRGTNNVTFKELLEYIHPDDREAVVNAVTGVLEKQSTGRYQAQFRTIGAEDGELRWLHCIGKAYFNAEGVAYRFAGALQDITQEMKARELQEVLFSLVENSQDFMATTDISGKFFYINPGGRELLGIEPGVDITQLNSSYLYAPEDLKIATEVIYPALAKDHKWSGIMRLQHVITRERIPFRAHCVEIIDPASNKVIGRGASLHDLRSELNAQKEQQKLLALLANTRDFVSLSNDAGDVSYVNAAGMKLLGIGSLEEARCHNSNYLVPSELEKLYEQVNKQLFEKGIWTGEIFYRHFKTGEAIPVEATTMLVFDPVTGESWGRATISRDLRGEKAARQVQLNNEQELERLVEIRTSELKKANIDLNIVNQNLEQFAYVASHDLQEPLRKINMFSALLQDKYKDQLNENGVRNLDIIRNASTRMTALIQDLLAFSRVSRQDHLFEKVDLQVVLQQVLMDVDVLIQQKNARIIVDELCTVSGIPLHMNQLFQNLLSNALKFSRKDVPPVIEITSRLLENQEIDSHPQLQNGRSYYEIKVKDNGIGFAPTYARKIFVIFQRLHGRGEYEGSGIGLALCQKIVIAHHGVIYAESEEGQGATFTVILPGVS